MAPAKGWATDLKSWRQVSESTGSAEWKRVTLHQDSRSQVPAKSGVYVMCVRTRDLHLPGKLFENLMSAIYVGQAGSLKTRFSQHVRGDRPGLRQAMQTFRTISFYYLVLEDKEQLSRVEQCLIDALGPSVNSINAMRARDGGEIKGQLLEGVPLRKGVA